MTEKTRAGREPIQVLQVDQDFCTRTYGSAPCTASIAAGGRKCFNTRGTCQDPENYEAGATVVGGVLTLHFCDNQARLPEDGNYYFPFLSTVQHTPGRINPGGGRSSAKALGQRAVLTATMKDFPTTDRIVDPYVEERDYNPLERSTFFAKWRARNPYYIGRKVRYISGYLSEDRQIVDAIESTFFITDMKGPDSSGKVTFVAKDILSKVQNDKAKAPNASTGSLLAAIDEVETSITLTPAGIGDAEYPTSGYIRIGAEVMSFTRSPGSDVCTVVRQEYNTTLSGHDAGDVVQLCLLIDAMNVPDILYLFLNTYAGIPDELLDKAGWDAEALDFLPRLYSTLITEPTGISQLIDEMCAQMYFYAWWDERANLVRIRSVRPAEDEEVTVLTDDRHLVEDSVNVQDLTNERLTEVWVYHALRDPTKDLTEAQNYGALEVRSNDGASAEKYGEAGIRVIYSRWITGENGAAAIDLGDRLLARYGKVPREVTFSLDAKDRDVWVGSFVQVEAPQQVVNDEGQPVPINLQILSAKEVSLGTTYTYTGQEYVEEAPPEPGVLLVVLTGELWNVNLREAFDNTIGIVPSPGDTVRFIVRSNAVIGGRITDQLYRDGYISNIKSGSGFQLGQTLVMPIYRHTVSPAQWAQLTLTADAGSTLVVRNGFLGPDELGRMYTDMRVYGAPVSMRTGLWPAGVNLEMTIEPGAKIIGAGGYGSLHCAAGSEFIPSSLYTEPPVVHWPSDGGHALAVEHPISINNLGEIAGGGAGGVGWTYLASGGAVHFVPGGGGAGSGPASTTVVTNIAGRPYTIEREASPASLSSPGEGAQIFIDNTGTDNRITCSEGAALGQQSVRDIVSTIETSINPNYHQYGRFIPFGGFVENGIGGFAVYGGKNDITWVNKGNVVGSELA